MCVTLRSILKRKFWNERGSFGMSRFGDGNFGTGENILEREIEIWDFWNEKNIFGMIVNFGMRKILINKK